MDLSLTLDSRDEATIVKEDGPDGFSAETIFKTATGCQGLTYDDVILMPGEPTAVPSRRVLALTTVYDTG